MGVTDGIAAGEVQVESVVPVALRTAPIIALRTNLAERTVVVATTACGRQKNGFSRSSIGKPSAAYAVLGCPRIAYFCSV